MRWLVSLLAIVLFVMMVMIVLTGEMELVP